MVSEARTLLNVLNKVFIDFSLLRKCAWFYVVINVKSQDQVALSIEILLDRKDIFGSLLSP